MLSIWRNIDDLLSLTAFVIALVYQLSGDSLSGIFYVLCAILAQIPHIEEIRK